MVMEVTSYPTRWLPHVSMLCICVSVHVCACSHVCSWLISYAVWIQQWLSLFFCRTEDKACHNNISRSSSRRAAMHTRSHTHTHVRALKRSGTPHLYIWVHKRVPPPRCLAQNVMLCSIPEQIGLLSPQEGRGRAKRRRRNRNDHSHFLTELTISLPRSEIGGSEKHTIRNHYSAPNCCWQA